MKKPPPRWPAAVSLNGLEMIYLASPYSHPSESVREGRFHAVCRAAAELMRAGEAVFSPIAHSHVICSYGLPYTWGFWSRIDREHLVRCDEAAVLMLDGWRESTGVQAEIRLATRLCKPVYFIRPADVGLSHVAWDCLGPRARQYDHVPQAACDAMRPRMRRLLRSGILPR